MSDSIGNPPLATCSHNGRNSQKRPLHDAQLQQSQYSLFREDPRPNSHYPQSFYFQQQQQQRQQQQRRQQHSYPQVKIAISKDEESVATASTATVAPPRILCFSSSYESVVVASLNHRHKMRRRHSCHFPLASALWMDPDIPFSEYAGQIVDNKYFQKVIVTMIVLNSITMGIGTFDFVTEQDYVEICFEYMDHAFLSIFTIELGLQICQKGWKVFKYGWLSFDLFVIVCSWMYFAASIFRFLKIFRTLRLLTRVRELRDLVTTFIQVIPHLIPIMIFLVLILYIFGVLFTMMFKDMYRDGQTSQDYFSRLDITFFTLFQLMIQDSVAAITKEVMVTHTWAWLPIMSYVMLSSFVIMHIVIEALANNTLHHKAQQAREEFEVRMAVATREQSARMEETLDILLTLMMPQDQKDKKKMEEEDDTSTTLSLSSNPPSQDQNHCRRQQQQQQQQPSQQPYL